MVVMLGTVALLALWGLAVSLYPRLRASKLDDSRSPERAVADELVEECGRLAQQGLASPMGGDGSRSLALPDGTLAVASTGYGRPNIGLNNTEGYVLAASDDGQRLLAAVCQGNEKHTSSMVAGALALAELHAHVCGAKRTLDLQQDLQAAMTEAHARIFRVSRDAPPSYELRRQANGTKPSSLRGIATSVTVVAIEGNLLVVAHVGAAAAFLVRDARVERLTASHVGVDAAEAREVLREHPDLAEQCQWMVWRVLGSSDQPSFDLFVRAIEPGDLLVLATSRSAQLALQGLIEGRAPAEVPELAEALRLATPPELAASTVVIRRSRSAGP